MLYINNLDTFLDTKLEISVLAGKSITFLILRSQPSLNVAGFTFRPTAAFQEKLYEKILDKTRWGIIDSIEELGIKI